MKKENTIKLNSFIIAFFFVLIMIAFSCAAFAASAPSASGQINAPGGAALRKTTSMKSAKKCVLPDDTGITIHKEVFKSKTSTSKKKKWYYVTANGMKGYIRADYVDNINYGTVSGQLKAKVTYRKGAGTKMKKKGTLKKNTTVTVVLKATPVSSTKGSSSKWYKILSGGKYYYVCSSKVKLTGNMTDDQFVQYLNAAGFPDSYKKSLITLHNAHPNWGFVGYNTNIPWTTALAKQTSGGRSLVSGSFPSSYRNGSKEYEPGWYKASSKVVAYFMDPRNFLNESAIFMFEDLSYKPDYQTAAAVNAIITPTKLPAYGFTANVFVNAGAASNVSPIFLASRARQETGNGSDAINGTKILGTTVYNPFNIGAFGGTNPLYNGLIYAYGMGWNTPEKATVGGAQELARNYINQGQFTTYYQRFNVRNGASRAGTHQYMTNIMAPYSEALATYDSYSKYGILNQPLVFEIPIYEGMPAATNLP